jgi:hypothetical protein
MNSKTEKYPLRAALAYPFAPYNQYNFRDGPSPDTVYIAHQALWAMGADVTLLDTEVCQKQILEGNRYDLVFEISGFASNSSLESLLGSICAAQEVSYFPSNQLPQQIAADKLISKHFAEIAGLEVPKTIVKLDASNTLDKLIVKPIAGGESKGIKEIAPEELANIELVDQFVEEFIHGVDVTFLTIKNPTTGKPEVIAAFCNKDSTQEAITSNETKKRDHYIYGQSIRTRTSILEKIDNNLLEKICSFNLLIGNPRISRLDFRSPFDDSEKHFFLEINTDPTLGANQLWYTPIQEWSTRSSFSDIFQKIDE